MDAFFVHFRAPAGGSGAQQEQEQEQEPAPPSEQKRLDNELAFSIV